MKHNIISLASVLLSVAVITPASANWQYAGDYVRTGAYADDGSRFTISVRGGGSFGFGGVDNEIGSLTANYYYDPSTGLVVSDGFYAACLESGDCDASMFELAGSGDIAALPAAKDYSNFSFAAGASVGWTVPNTPQWRLELGWDHISESEYNASPMFDGDLTLSSGMIVNVQSGGVHSKVTADIISAMAFYDFFDGIEKPSRQIIPYVGFGVGYADVQTVLHLTDLYGDLSLSADLQNYGELDKYNILQFYKSEKDNSTVAGVLAGGMSYGITDAIFLDFGARLMYVPNVKWALSDKEGDRSRDWFGVKSMFWANVMLGIRAEF